MGRKRENLKIKNVTFKYSGTDNDLTLFLKTIVYDYLVKNDIITNIPPNNVNYTGKNK